MQVLFTDDNYYYLFMFLKLILQLNLTAYLTIFLHALNQSGLKCHPVIDYIFYSNNFIHIKRLYSF